MPPLRQRHLSRQWGGELTTVLEVAMTDRLPYSSLRNRIFARPTLTEALSNLFTAMDKSLGEQPRK